MNIAEASRHTAAPRSNRVSLACAAVIVAVGLAAPPTVALEAKPSASTRVGKTWTGRVVVVADGDTLEVLRDGRAIRVRLAGIDAPETGQAWSRRARARLSELVFRRDVGVVVRDVDRYGRDIVDVTLADGRRVNDLLVAEGLAWFYSSYSRDQTLARLEKEARSAKRGVWSQQAPTPLWVWRQRHPRKSG